MAKTTQFDQSAPRKFPLACWWFKKIYARKNWNW